MKRVRGLGALLVLVSVIGVVPALLWQATGLLDWTALVRQFPAALLRPDDGSLLIALLVVVGWLAWAAFTASFVVELIALLSRKRIHVQLPGLGRSQSVASGLLITVAALLSGPLSASAEPMDPPAPHVAAANPQPAVERPAPQLRQLSDRGEPSLRYRVERGDHLWSIAERFYGDGTQWSRIAEANADLIADPSEIEIGWVLVIPGVPAAHTDADSRAGAPELQSPAESEEHDAEDSSQPMPHQDTPVPESSVGERAEPPVAEQTEPPVTERIEPPFAETPVAEESVEARPRVSAAPETNPVEPDASPEPMRTAVPEESSAGATTTPAAVPRQTTSDPEEERASEASMQVRQKTDWDIEDRLIALTGGVGSLLAAGLLAQVVGRRGGQLAQRGLGQRLIHPDPLAQLVESALGVRQDSAGLRTLDAAVRRMGRHFREQDGRLPRLAWAAMDRQRFIFQFRDDPGDPPEGFAASLNQWTLERHIVEGSVWPESNAGPSPWPALVVLGGTPDGQTMLLDLEAAGSLRLEAADRELANGVVNALLMELSCAWWNDECEVILAGGDSLFVRSVDLPRVRVEPRLDRALEYAERVVQQRQAGMFARDRLDPATTEAWRPIVLVVGAADEAQWRRLNALTVEPERGVAVVTSLPGASSAWTPRRGAVAADAEPSVRLRPPPELTTVPGLPPLALQLVDEEVRNALVQLFRATASTQTRPAPWWRSPGEAGDRTRDPTDSAGEGAQVTTNTVEEEHVVTHLACSHPIVLLLGPVELVAATGQRPSRAIRQCIEYAAWLLEHPGSTAPAMTRSLLVAEGTRRSNMSRLRTWLGNDPEGQAYLPEAYSGRIRLHPDVTSDWQRFQLFLVGGVNRAPQSALISALELVRGAPLADAAPGQWHWAEELRTDMCSMIRDVGVVLAGLALDRNDIDLARWATARALSAAPEDELLLCARLRTEHQAGNRIEVERLSMRLTRQARLLNIDLDDQTVALLQVVLEGRERDRKVIA